MNKAFKTRQVLGHVSVVFYSIEKMKRNASMSCHVKVGEPIPLNDHPLKDEVFAKINSGEIVFS
tara:strand:- start:8814 stop:9005 length:192 start_codon:yes stop_codon:yes gene_type:complete